MTTDVTAADVVRLADAEHDDLRLGLAELPDADLAAVGRMAELIVRDVTEIGARRRGAAWIDSRAAQVWDNPEPQWPTDDDPAAVGAEVTVVIAADLISTVEGRVDTGTITPPHELRPDTTTETPDTTPTEAAS